MDLSRRLLLFLSICVIFWSHLSLVGVLGIKCYSCSDCETYYNDTHLIDCGETEDRCLAIILENGEMDRACGSKEICTRSESPPPTTAKPTKVRKREDFSSSPPKKRTVRQLLQQQLKTTAEPKKELPEFSSMHCCKEDECNSAFSIRQNVPTLLFSGALFARNLQQQSTFSILLLLLGLTLFFTNP